MGAVDDGLENAGHDVGGLRVLEAALAAPGKGASAAGGDDYIVGALLEHLVPTASGLVAGELGSDLRDSVEG